MDPRDLINKNMTISDLMKKKGGVVWLKNKILSDYKYEDVVDELVDRQKEVELRKNPKLSRNEAGLRAIETLKNMSENKKFGWFGRIHGYLKKSG